MLGTKLSESAMAKRSDSREGGTRIGGRCPILHCDLKDSEAL